MPSAVIRDYEYDDESRVLCIIFVSGKIYEYEQVAASVYLGLSTAFSKGTFFNRFIKDQYRYREIAPSQD
jgi:KTSC domain